MVKYFIQLCTTVILWDSYYLREHLRIKHKMQMITYKNRFVNNYNENITGITIHIQVNSKIIFYVEILAEEAKLKSRKLKGRPARKRKKKESEDEDDDETFDPGDNNI